MPSLDNRVLRVPLKEVLRPGYERVVVGEGGWVGGRGLRRGKGCLQEGAPRLQGVEWKHRGNQLRCLPPCASTCIQHVLPFLACDLVPSYCAHLVSCVPTVPTLQLFPAAGMPNSKTGQKGNLRLRLDIAFPRKQLNESERAQLEALLKDKM